MQVTKDANTRSQNKMEVVCKTYTGIGGNEFMIGSSKISRNKDNLDARRSSMKKRAILN